LFALVLRDPGGSIFGGRPGVVANQRNIRRCRQGERGAFASPPDHWGRTQTEDRASRIAAAGPQRAGGHSLQAGHESLSIRPLHITASFALARGLLRLTTTRYHVRLLQAVGKVIQFHFGQMPQFSRRRRSNRGYLFVGVDLR